MNLRKRKKNAGTRLVAGFLSYFTVLQHIFELKLGFGGQVHSDVSLLQWLSGFILLFCFIVSERALYLEMGYRTSASTRQTGKVDERGQKESPVFQSGTAAKG